MTAQITCDGRVVGIMTILDPGAFVDSAGNSKRMVVHDDIGGNWMDFTPEHVVIPEKRVTPLDPPIPWDPSVTREELERRKAEDTWLTYDELKAMLGWQ